MEWLIWIGAALTLFGIGLLGYCIWVVARARKAGGSDDEVKARMQKVVALNMLALMTSALGLGAVSVGIFLS